MAELDRLMAAVDRVNVLDAAGKVLAAPLRHHASQASVIAMAHATELFWSAVIAAQLLLRAVDRPVTGNDEQDASRDTDINQRLHELRLLIDQIMSGTTEPKEE